MCGGLELIMGIVGAVGQIAGGMAAKEDAKLRAEVARMNADVAERTAQTDMLLAELPVLSAELEESRVRDALRAGLATQKATYATGNIDTGYGAPLLAAGVAASQATLDINLIRIQGQLGHAERMSEAASAQAGAASQHFAVVQAENQADNAMMQAIFGAASTFLGMGKGGGFSFGGSSASTGGFDAMAPAAGTVPSYSRGYTFTAASPAATPRYDYGTRYGGYGGYIPGAH